MNRFKENVCIQLVDLLTVPYLFHNIKRNYFADGFLFNVCTYTEFKILIFFLLVENRIFYPEKSRKQRSCCGRIKISPSMRFSLEYSLNSEQLVTMWGGGGCENC